MSLGRVAKEIIGGLAVGAGVIYVALDDNRIATDEWVTAIISTLVAFGAILATSPWALAKYAKAVVTGLAAAGAVIAAGLVDGPLTAQEILKAVIEGLLAAGLIGAVVPNAAVSDVYRRNTP